MTSVCIWFLYYVVVKLVIPQPVCSAIGCCTASGWSRIRTGFVLICHCFYPWRIWWWTPGFLQHHDPDIPFPWLPQGSHPQFQQWYHSKQEHYFSGTTILLNHTADGGECRGVSVFLCMRVSTELKEWSTECPSNSGSLRISESTALLYLFFSKVQPSWRRRCLPSSEVTIYSAPI